jgi:hypothetical protein
MEVTITPPENNFFDVRSKINDYEAFQKNEIVEVSYLKEDDLPTNVTCIRITTDTLKLFEESICNKVKIMEIVLRKQTQSKVLNPWKVEKRIENSQIMEHSSAVVEEVVCGLSDFCAVYEIGLRIVETSLSAASTANLIIPLVTVGPVDFKNQELTEAINLDDLKLDEPSDLALVYSKPNSISLQWNKNDTNCFSGYTIVVKGHSTLNMLGIMLFT